MGYVLGIDVGSSFTKAVVLREKDLLSWAGIPSGGNHAEAARKVSQAVLDRAGLSDTDVSATIATGYGAAAAGFADRIVADISCQAAAIHHLFPTARTVVDIGSQFCRNNRDRVGSVGYVAPATTGADRAGGHRFRRRQRQISSGHSADTPHIFR